MATFLLCILASIITGGGFLNATYSGVTVVYLILGMLCVSYTYYFLYKHESLCIGTVEKSLLFFECWGLFYILLSVAGVFQGFQTDLSFDLSFLPRQAVYFFVLPVVILFREDRYFRGIDGFLKKYGEILFWTLYLAQMLFFQQFIMAVISQVLLCWLSLRLNTSQSWRKWARIAVLLFTPMMDAGKSTILIIRMLFLVVCIVPKGWSRVAFRLIALVLLVTVISCFIIPVTVGDTVFTDWNTAWRVRTWKDEEMVLANTNYLGTGYGTAYQSETYINGTFLRNEWQYRAAEGYTEQERKFVTGSHNSFVSVAMRTGVIGILLFLSFLITLFWNLVKYKELPSKASYFAFFAGVLIIMFNVGLESPGYLFPFTFLMGVCVREGKKLKEKNQVSEEQGLISEIKCETA